MRGPLWTLLRDVLLAGMFGVAVLALVYAVMRDSPLACSLGGFVIGWALRGSAGPMLKQKRARP